MRRLTEWQVAVLAALERAGAAATVPELHRSFPQFPPSELVRVPNALVRRGLVGWTGNRSWLYLGELSPEEAAEWIGSGHAPVPAKGVVRFRALPRSGR